MNDDAKELKRVLREANENWMSYDALHARTPPMSVNKGEYAALMRRTKLAETARVALQALVDYNGNYGSPDTKTLEAAVRVARSMVIPAATLTVTKDDEPFFG